MFKFLIILILFGLGLYYYGYFGQNIVEGFNAKKDCPNILIQKGNRIYLKNTNLAEVPGVNPMVFDNLEDYVEFLQWERSQGIHCDVLYLKHEYDAQGNGVYKIRPDIMEPSGGSQAMPPGKIDSLDEVTVPSDKNYPLQAQLPPKQKLMDAGRNDPPYNTQDYPGFDPMNQYEGLDTPLDKLYNVELNQKESDNPMDANWGGIDYSNQVVDSGYYEPNTRKSS